MSRRVYTACVVKDTNGTIHDLDIYTGSYDWSVRLRAVRRECLRHGIEIMHAYVGGNFWSRREVMTA